MKPSGSEYILGYLVGITGILAKAKAVTILWAWFMVRDFGLPPIGISTVLISTMIYQLVTPQPEKEDKPWDTRAALWTGVLLPWLLAGVGLGLGYIVKIAF